MEKTGDTIVQRLSEKDLADGIFDAKVMGGRLKECAFYIEKYQMSFSQEDTIELNLFGYPFRALVVGIRESGKGLMYINCIVKWKR